MTDDVLHERPTARPAADEPQLDRTISPIAGRLTSSPRGKAVAFGGLLAGCAVFAFATWSADRPKAPRPPERPARQVVAFEPASGAPSLADPGPAAPSLSNGTVSSVPAIDPSTSDTAPTPAAGRAPAGNPRTAPIMAYSQGAQRQGSDPATPSAIVPALLPANSEGTELDQLRRGSRIGRASARQLGDRNFLILAGATIPCTLQTAIDTNTPGYVTCLIGVDVYSDNGAVVLLEKGTRVLGEYRGGMRQGQRRVFVLWTRAVTPNGMAMDLVSPAADALGRAGFDGDIDNHFWDRFGAALLLSIVDDGAYALAGPDSRSATARLPSDAAGMAVRNGADIPPTLRKPQGSQVAILAAQDFDFSNVYRLKARAP